MKLLVERPTELRPGDVVATTDDTGVTRTGEVLRVSPFVEIKVTSACRGGRPRFDKRGRWVIVESVFGDRRVELIERAPTAYVAARLEDVVAEVLPSRRMAG